MHALVASTDVLDVNSVYLYLLICRDFAKTSIVARVDDEVVGMVSGYIPPEQPGTLFIWQVAVAQPMRGCGLAGAMLDALLARLGPTITAIETTVAPTNGPSRRLFAKWAQRLGVAMTTSPGFPERLFPAGQHEAEPRLTLGPLATRK